jgi:hypothetical protein
MKEYYRVEPIPINRIRASNGEQSLRRAIINAKDGLVSRTKGRILVTKNRDGTYTIGDGFHRLANAVIKHQKWISADVRIVGRMK